MISVSFPFAFHEHERKHALLASHLHEQIKNNIKMYFSANGTLCLYEIRVIRVFGLGGTCVFECISAGAPGAGRKQSRSYIYSELMIS